MSQLFMPEDQKELSELLTPESDKPVKEALVFVNIFGNVFAMDKLDCKEPVKLLGGRQDDIAYVEGKLYAGGENGKVYDVMEQEKVYENDFPIRSLGVYNDQLYLGDEGGKVINVFHDNVTFDFGNTVSAICQQGSDLYAAVDNYVHDVFTGNKVKERMNDVNALFCFPDNLLFDAGTGLFLCDKDIITPLPGFSNMRIYSIFSYGSDMFVVNEKHDVFDFITKEQVGNISHVYNIKSVPRDVLGGMLDE